MLVKQSSFYERVGLITELLAVSDHHARARIYSYIPSQVLTPLRKNQAGVYLDRDGGVKAFITWAYVTREIEKALCESGRSIKSDEWDSGQRLFINDFVCPYGNTREILRDARQRYFQNYGGAASVRRHEDGRVRKVNLWR